MKAPLDPEPLDKATSLPLMFELDFCLFTAVCDDPRELDAGRLAANIVEGGRSQRITLIAYKQGLLDAGCLSDLSVLQRLVPLNVPKLPAGNVGHAADVFDMDKAEGPEALN